jgi:hypothetical protein
MPVLVNGREIIEDLATAGHDFGMGVTRRETVSVRAERNAARFVLRFLENCPDDATVMDLREAVQEAYPDVLSGGGGGL